MLSCGFGAAALKFASYDDDLSGDKPVASSGPFLPPEFACSHFRSQIPEAQADCCFLPSE